MTPCDRTGCPGELDATGYCTVCMMPPLGSAARRDVASPPSQPSRSAKPARPATRRAPGSGPGSASGSSSDSFSSSRPAATGPADETPREDDPDVDVPLIPPEAALLDDPQVPEEDRVCAQCGRELGRSYDGEPRLLQGRCPWDRTPYFFIPELARGEVLKERYEIEGCIGRGGLGWVYVARDLNLDRRVAIKGLILADDPAAIQDVQDEKRFLIELRHPDIVEITDFVTHAPQGRRPRGYIVMEYVPGLPMTSPRLPDLNIRQILRHGLRILGVFRFLHEREYLFCDLKPDNVMAYGTKAKLIDLGAVRKLGEPGIGPYTTGYDAPELSRTGSTVATDIYTVGRTLEYLFLMHAGDTDAAEYESLRLLLDRALAEDPEQRFESAAAMAGQLAGVLGELTARRTRRTRLASSELFARPAALIDNGWSAVPDLRRWMTGSAREAARTGAAQPLDVRPPQSAQAAVALPRPLPDPADSAAGFLDTSVSADPAEADRQLADYQDPTRAIHLRRCHVLVQLGRFDDARDALNRAASEAPDYWQVAWHTGVLELASGNPRKAEQEFAACRKQLPGESAVQLALALCGEYLARDDARLEAVAERYLTAWRMDMWQESAAVGFARVRARLGKRQEAIKVLSEVPDTSPHRRAVRAATLRLRVGWFGGADGAAPGPEDLAAAERELGALAPEGSADRERFVVLVVEAALAAGHGDGRAGGPPLNLLNGRQDEHGIRLLLSDHYRGLALQATSEDQHTVLVDLANVARPLTWR